MVPVTTTTTTIPVTTTATTSADTSTATTGIAATTSAITSAATTAAESTGICDTISNGVAKIVEFVRSCLAKLPLIGSFFARTDAATTTAATTTAATTVEWTDTDRFNMIAGQFRAAAATSTEVLTVPEADTVTYTLGLFAAITTPAVQVQAFHAVLSAVNSTDDIARQFYATMDEALQTQFRHEIWVANGNADDHHGLNYGHHMVATQIRAAIPQQAALNLQVALAAATTAATTAGTTAGTTTAATTTAATTI